MQEVKKPHNQDLRADPAWSINSGKIESSPGDFPDSVKISGFQPGGRLPFFHGRESF